MAIDNVTYERFPHSGEAIKRLRTEKGFDQREFANLVGLSWDQMDNIESDRLERGILWEYAQRIAEKLGVELFMIATRPPGDVMIPVATLCDLGWKLHMAEEEVQTHVEGKHSHENALGYAQGFKAALEGLELDPYMRQLLELDLARRLEIRSCAEMPH